MKIRSERRGEEAIIRDLTAEAFAPMAHSDGSEPAIIDRLRREGDLTLSLVAESDGLIVGHVALSPVTIDGVHDGWFGLGPIAVRPDRQRSGIGSALVGQGHRLLEARGAVGCALIGDPGYYRRFGYRSDGRLTYRDVPARYVQWISFGGASAEGVLEFAPAFGP